MSDVLRLILKTDFMNNYPRKKTLDEKCASDLVEELKNCNGISVYTIDDEVTPIRIAAAFKAGGSGAADISYVVVPEEKLVFVFKPDLGELIDDRVNKNHRNYNLINCKEFAGFADVLYDAGYDTFNKADIQIEIDRRGY